MRRNESIFDIDSSVHEEIAEGIRIEGSNLCGISAHCSWEGTNNNGIYSIYKLYICIVFNIF